MRIALAVCLFAIASCRKPEAPPALSTSWAGWYHIDVERPHLNLELAANGKFRWVEVGCDWYRAGVGRWKEEDGKAVLERLDIEQRYRDYVKNFFPTVDASVTRVELVRAGAGVQASWSGRGQSTWMPGGMCVTCGQVRDESHVDKVKEKAREMARGYPGIDHPVGETPCEDPLSAWPWEKFLEDESAAVPTATAGPVETAFDGGPLPTPTL